jgi:phosphoinositide-3-kinase regulatory subunit 4
MDVFSAGCVFIETYLNGEVVFDLASLMRYREENTLIPVIVQKLNKIDRRPIRAVCEHMLNLDPAKRKSAAEYKKRLELGEDGGAVVFPPSFSSFLYPLMRRLRHDVLTPDARIALITEHYEEAVRELTGLEDKEGGRCERRASAQREQHGRPRRPQGGLGGSPPDNPRAKLAAEGL